MTESGKPRRPEEAAVGKDSLSLASYWLKTTVRGRERADMVGRLMAGLAG